MFGIGGFELFIIVVFIFVIFGPDKLPEIIKLAGMGIKKFRKAKAEMDQVLKEEIVDPVMKVANEPDPPKNDEEKNTISEKKELTKKSTTTNKDDAEIKTSTIVDAEKKGGK